MSYNPLIYGSSTIERIVSIEPTDSGTEIFTEHPDGFVTSNIIPNEYWILANKCLDQFFHPLKGNLNYKWIKTFKSRKSFTGDRARYKNEDIFSIWNPKEAHMLRSGLSYFKGMKHDEVSSLAFDIETTSLEHTPNAKVLIISNAYQNKGKIERKLFAYDDYADEGEMLKAWCEWVREKDPTIILGHNILMYDFPYLQHIAQKYGVELLLGRNDSKIEFDDWDSEYRKDANTFYTYKKTHIYGREVIDTLFLSYKYDIGRKYENYSLKNIVKQEGLEVPDRQFYDASLIRTRYKDPIEWTKIKQYAEHDADDALNIYLLMSPVFFYLTQSVPRSFQHIIESATGGQINAMMNRAYLQDGHSIPAISQMGPYEGGISFGNAGIWSNCQKIDVKQMYPSIILEYNLHDKEKDPKAYLVELCKFFTSKREEYKLLAKTDFLYDAQQQTFKILSNSLYGTLGSKFNNFNFPQGAAFITEKGRDILKLAIKWAEDKDLQIVNGDTDSIMFCKKDQSTFAKEERKNLLLEINTLLPSQIQMADDGYYTRVIVLKAKNYILFDGQEIKYKGSAIKSTGKEAALRQYIKDILNTMLAGNYDFLTIYNQYVKEIMDLKDIHRWTSKKTISSKVLAGERTNELIIKNAIAGTEYQEGDKAYFYYKSDDTLCLAEKFAGDYNKSRLLEKLYKTASGTFETVIDPKTFINYSLKRSQGALEALIKS